MEIYNFRNRMEVEINGQKATRFSMDGNLFVLDDHPTHQVEILPGWVRIRHLETNNIIFEKHDKIYPIREWFEVVDGQLHNLGIPVYIINFNNLSFLKKMVSQLEKFTKNIHVIDNHSTFPQLLEYYDTDYPYFLHRMDENYGYSVYMKLYDEFPRIFAITDPDLEFNPELPTTFLADFVRLTEEHRRWKVGMALSLLDADKMFPYSDYFFGQSICQWEIKFWSKKVAPDLYDAAVDTTFAVWNKAYAPIDLNRALTHNRGLSLRVAGNYQCRHLPWYKDWLKDLTPEEIKFVSEGNNSSSIIRLMKRHGILS